MKLNIKVKLLNPKCKIDITKNGDWIDLRAAKKVHLNAPIANRLHAIEGKKVRDIDFDSTYIPLGVIIQLPKGCEAHVVPRSSTWKHFKFIQPNHFGIIDQLYCGPNDEWHMPVIAFSDMIVEEGDRICQFRIALSQKATLWQKIKYYLSNGVKIKYVENINKPNRGGLGHSGVK